MSVDKKELGTFDEPSSPGGVDESGPLDLEDPEAAARRRRRRSGLRIPSDNVPRPQAAGMSGPTSAVSSAPVSSPAVSAPPASASSAPAPSPSATASSPATDASSPPAASHGAVPEPIEGDPEVSIPAPVAAKRADSESDVDVDVDFADEDDATASAPGTNGAMVAASAAGSGEVAASTSPLGGVAAASADTSSRAADTIPQPPDEEVLADDDLVAETPRPELAAPPAVEARPADGGDDAEDLSVDEIEEVSSGPTTVAQPVPPSVAQAAPAGPAAPVTGGRTTIPPVAPATSGRTTIPPIAPAAGQHHAPPPVPPAAKEHRPQPPAAPPPASKNAVAAAAAVAAELNKPKKRKARAWFEEIFDDDYLRTLPFLTPQATQREAAFIAEGLGLKPGAQVLDVGCGYGRHAMELAARGYHVVALDLSLPLLIRGADEAQRRGLNINFVHGDMRELTFDSQFDGAYCVFSTFGYFDDETNKRVAQNIARALKPGGKVIIEVLNRDYIVPDLPTRVWWEGDGCVVLEEVDFNYYASRIISNRSVVFEDGRQLEQEISIRAYSLHELGKLLHQGGFRVTEISGNLAARGRFFGSHSRQLIVIAEKRAPDAGREASQPVDLSAVSGNAPSTPQK